MCGLAGILAPGSGDPGAAARGMVRALSHRGPDASDVWSDAEAGISLAHARLAILDLSPAGAQPMASVSGRWQLVFNGEVYNHLELRERLRNEGAAPAWRGHADTETVLACIEAWGFTRTLDAMSGMFALALFDRHERQLWLARDRAGEKPLYYARHRGAFIFGSELKALRAHPSFVADVDRTSVALLLRNGYIPSPRTIYQDAWKLPPAHWLRIDASGAIGDGPTPYWSLAAVAESGQRSPFAGSDAQALDELDAVLGHAVRGQMLSDVPLGALLSGGIDSSLVASVMQRESGTPIRTFTIGFEEAAYDEAAHARAVAAHLGTNHTEMRVSAADALAVIPSLPAMYDEPLADSSQLPTHLVMKLARRNVTVALSGDGGDEVFGGYNRYFLAPRVVRRMGWLPGGVRRIAGRAMRSMPASVLDAWGPLAGVARPGTQLHKLGERIGVAHDLDALYLGLVSEWPDAEHVVIGASRLDGLLDRRADWPVLSDGVARMMALDFLTYLPDDILAKVDRAAMAVSLETRAPFLDRDVVEFAWRLPQSMKLRDGKGKWILRALLQRHLPRELFERPKMGFALPLDAWLRGPLREWAEALLDESRLQREGYFRPAPIRRAWTRHLRGGTSHGAKLWSVLMFQAWLEQQALGAGSAAAA